MTETVLPIPLKDPIGFGVNAYLVKGSGGFVLIDTGTRSCRTQLERALSDAGCAEGNLALILLTHGDFDHAGNARYLKQRSGASIVMHSGDLGMVEYGNMLWNRSSGPVQRLVFGLFRLKKEDRFSPDSYVDQLHSLEEYGLAAKIIPVPGHSKGSVGVLTESGRFFCGDLFENRREPKINALCDNPEDMAASLRRLASERIDTVYPGHGRPFRWSELGGAAAPAPRHGG